MIHPLLMAKFSITAYALSTELLMNAPPDAASRAHLVLSCRPLIEDIEQCLMMETVMRARVDIRLESLPGCRETFQDSLFESRNEVSKRDRFARKTIFSRGFSTSYCPSRENSLRRLNCQKRFQS